MEGNHKFDKYKILIINIIDDKYHIVKSMRELSAFLQANYDIIKSHMYYHRYFNKNCTGKKPKKTLVIDNIIIHFLSF